MPLSCADKPHGHPRSDHNAPLAPVIIIVGIASLSIQTSIVMHQNLFPSSIPLQSMLGFGSDCIAV